MRGVQLSDELAQIEFAKRAAKRFAENQNLSSYTDSEIVPGCFLALRWGLGDDCVLVMKLDYEHVPTNYHQLVRELGVEDAGSVSIVNAIDSAQIAQRLSSPEGNHDLLNALNRNKRQPVADANGWIKWEGGECPVPLGTLVDVKQRNGMIFKGVKAIMSAEASPLAWRIGYDGKIPDHRDITAYRLHQSKRPEDDEGLTASDLVGGES